MERSFFKQFWRRNPGINSRRDLVA
jgi:hypothetical protein